MKDNHAKRFMREENRKIDQKNSGNSMKKKKLLKQFAGIGNANVKFICLSCGEKESIPMDVVKFLDDADIANDPNNPPNLPVKNVGRRCIQNIIETPLE